MLGLFRLKPAVELISTTYKNVSWYSMIYNLKGTGCVQIIPFKIYDEIKIQNDPWVYKKLVIISK